jgi:hypothetical protein
VAAPAAEIAPSASQLIAAPETAGRFAASAQRINGLSSTLKELIPKRLPQEVIDLPAASATAQPSAPLRTATDRDNAQPEVSVAGAIDQTQTTAQRMTLRSFFQELGATLSYIVGSLKKVPTNDPQKPFTWKYTPPHSLVFATGLLGALFSFNVSDIMEFVILPALMPNIALPALAMGLPFSWALAGSGMMLLAVGMALQRPVKAAQEPAPAGSWLKRLAQKMGFDFSREPQKAFSILAINTFMLSVAEKIYSMMQTFLMQSLNLGSTGVGTLRNYMWYATVLNRPLVGAFADKVEIKKGYAIFTAISAIIFAGIPTLLVMGKLSMISLAVLSFFSYLATQIAGSITQNRLQNEIAGDDDKARSSGNVLTSMWRNYGTYVGLALAALIVGNPAAAAAASVKTMFAVILSIYVGVKLLAAAVFYYGIHIPKKAPAAPAAVPQVQAASSISPDSAKKPFRAHVGRALSFAGFAGVLGGTFLIAGVGFNVFSLFLALSLAWGVGPHLGANTAKKLLKDGILGSSEKKILGTIRTLALAPLLLTTLLAGSHIPLWISGIIIAAALIGIYTVRECVCNILAYTLIQDNAVIAKKEQGKAAAAVITMTYLGTIFSNKLLKWLLPKEVTIQAFWNAPGAVLAIVIGAVVLTVFTAFVYPKLSRLHEWIEKVKAPKQ